MVSYAECRYAECCYAECRYAEYHYAERRYAECCFAECRYAECCYAECHYAEYRYAERHYVVILSIVMLSVTRHFNSLLLLIIYKTNITAKLYGSVVMQYVKHILNICLQFFSTEKHSSLLCFI